MAFFGVLSLFFVELKLKIVIFFLVHFKFNFEVLFGFEKFVYFLSLLEGLIFEFLEDLKRDAYFG